MKIPAIRLNTSAKSFHGPAPSYANVRKPKWIPRDAQIRWIGKVDQEDHSELIKRLQPEDRAQLLEGYRRYCAENNLPTRIPGLLDGQQTQAFDQTTTDDRATSATQHNLSTTQHSPTDSTATHIGNTQPGNDPTALPSDSPLAISTDPTQDDPIAVPPDNDHPSFPPTNDGPQAILLGDHSPHSPVLSASETPTTPSASRPEPPTAEPDVQIGSPLKLSDSQSEGDVAEKLDSEGMTSFGALTGAMLWHN